MTDISTRDLPDGSAARSAAPAVHLALPWRRLMAFIVDLIITGLPLWAVGLVFFEAMSDLGNSGVLIGWAVVLAYFGYFDSALGDGRSPGKHATGIVVVGSDGTLLPPIRAVARAFVVTAPIFLTSLSVGTVNSVTTILVGLLGSALSCTTVYLTLFNRRTGQAWHDLLVGAVVLRAGRPLPVLPPIWRWHWAVVAAILLLGMWNAAVDLLSGEVDEGAVVAREVERLPFVRAAEVAAKGTTCDTCKDRRTTKVVSVNVLLRRQPADRDAALRQVVDAVFASGHPIVNEGRLRVVFVRGFNFGVVQFAKSEPMSADVAQWRAGQYPRWADAGRRASIGSGRVLSIGTSD
jgi:uncharacterized RDD family membrane protein YckC